VSGSSGLSLEAEANVYGLGYGSTVVTLSKASRPLEQRRSVRSSSVES